jgi:hypothetical protein
MNPSFKYLVIHTSSGSADSTTSLLSASPFLCIIDRRIASGDSLDIASYRQITIPELGIIRDSERGHPVAYEIFF